MFEAIKRAIEAHDTVILHRHATPDGDALGSQIGLKHLILENYPGKTVYTVGDAAMRYSFMADSVMDDIPDASYENALAIILDTSGKTLISDGRYTLAKTTARIDHHLFIEQIAQIEVTDSSFESCCGLVTQMALESGWRVNLPLPARIPSRIPPPEPGIPTRCSGPPGKSWWRATATGGSDPTIR